MSGERIFGPGHDREPGITPVPGSTPPFVIEWMSESAAVHSKSRGWLPAIVVRIATMDGSGLVGTLVVDDKLDEIIEGLTIARDRARLDVKAAGL